MRNLKIKPFAYLLFALFTLCLVLVALISGHQITDLKSALFVSYKTIPILLVLCWIFTKFGWKWQIFQSWLVPFPDLNGTWEGTIQTTWKNPKTGETPGPIPVILTIKQSFAKISCVMRTGEMTSRSYLAGFWVDSDEQLKMLGYCYTSKPSTTVAERSQPHDGTITFEVIENPASKLKGTYWTERKTTGEVILTHRINEHLDDYPDDIGEHPMTSQR